MWLRWFNVKSSLENLRRLHCAAASKLLSSRM